MCVCSAGAMLFGAEPKLLPQNLLEDGWISLFDGETMYGWQPIGESKWEVAEGEIRTNGAKPGWLMTTTRWADYDLHVEFQADPHTNSGVFLRTPLQPTDPAKDCYELNIAPANNAFPTCSFVGRKRSPGIIGQNISRPLTLATPQPLAVWDGKWHAFDVHATGGKFMVECDGSIVLEYDDPMPLRIGHIGLQSREGAVAFRNLRLRPTGLKPLFNGKDLTGWTTERTEKSKFDVTKNGEMHLVHGPGQIDTTADFANLVLQLECKVNGDRLNSGIFLRTLRKGRWAGYESQIQNAFNDGDRTKPKDYGTGAIYRRQPARRVMADDHKWFTKTIVADGPHFAVWVNGYQVSDWTDTRPAKESGREGLRLGAGAITIQGHDRTTDFLFRNIRAAELPK